MISPSDHFRAWLNSGISGCLFAKRFGGKQEAMTFVDVSTGAGSLVVSGLDKLLDDSAVQQRPVGLVLVSIQSEIDLVDLLNWLPTNSDRWRIIRPNAADETHLHVGLQWQTKDGCYSEVMGFAPLTSMPWPRRAPFYALTLWPGGHDNPFFKPAKADRISFADAAHGFVEREKYDVAWKKTETAVREIVDDPKYLYRTSFVLPLVYADRFNFP